MITYGIFDELDEESTDYKTGFREGYVAFIKRNRTKGKTEELKDIDIGYIDGFLTRYNEWLESLELV